MDSVEVAFRLKAFSWSLFAVVPAAVIGSYIGANTRAPLLVTVAFVVGGVGLAFFVSLAVAERAGRTAGSLYFSSGASTRGRREYSLADSLIARGLLADAIAELERAAALHVDDTEPPLRLARLLRDRCARPEDAILWFRTAVERSAGDAGLEIGALREIIEVYTHVLRTPRRALPDLARLASRHANTAAGAWARREMTELKQMMREEESQ